MTSLPDQTALELWLADFGLAPRRLSPTAELQAEHGLMEVVLAAMEAEAERMLTGGSLRTGFWSDVVDFNGNFVHQCHRAKEEDHLVPALVAHHLLAADQEAAIHKEHVSGKEMTLTLCEGVGEGDWEKVLRLVSIYAHILRPHMRREESGIFAMAAELPDATQARLGLEFAAVDRRALGDRGREHFVAVARRLASGAGVACDLPDAG